MHYPVIHDCPDCGQHVLPIIGSSTYHVPVIDHQVWLHCPCCYAWLADLAWIIGGDPACEHRWEETEDDLGWPKIRCRCCGAEDRAGREILLERVLEREGHARHFVDETGVVR